jgi:O-antigen/teichoic acid export membrane protein
VKIVSATSIQSVARTPAAPEVAPPPLRLAEVDDAPVLRGLPWAVLGNFVYALSQYAVVVVLARVGTPQVVGQYALALAIAGPVMFLCSLQLRAILASDTRRSIRFAEYWRLRIITTPIAVAIVALIALVGRYTLETTIVILVAAAAKSVETFSDLCFGASQRDKRLDLVGKSLTFKGPMSVVVLGAATWATQSVAIGMACVGAAWFVLFLCYDWPNVRRGASSGFKTLPLPLGEGWGEGESNNVAPSPCPFLNEERFPIAERWKTGRDWSAAKHLVAIGLPLSSALALLSFTVALPNVLVERYLGERDVGIYAALTSLAWAGVPLINAMGQTFMPSFGHLHSAGNHRQLRIVVAKLAAIGGGIGLLGLACASLFGEPLVSRCYGPVYAWRIDVLMWLMAAATLLFAARFFSDALTAMRCSRVQLLAQAVAAIVVIAGSVAVLPRHGLVGVAIVLTVAFALRGIILVACFWLETRPQQPLLKLYGGESN